jgi:hypothetical protein
MAAYIGGTLARPDRLIIFTTFGRRDYGQEAGTEASYKTAPQKRGGKRGTRERYQEHHRFCSDCNSNKSHSFRTHSQAGAVWDNKAIY